jgi:hypothetical protein
MKKAIKVEREIIYDFIGLVYIIDHMIEQSFELQHGIGGLNAKTENTVKINKLTSPINKIPITAYDKINYVIKKLEEVKKEILEQITEESRL